MESICVKCAPSSSYISFLSSHMAVTRIQRKTSAPTGANSRQHKPQISPQLCNAAAADDGPQSTLKPGNCVKYLSLQGTGERAEAGGGLLSVCTSGLHMFGAGYPSQRKLRGRSSQQSVEQQQQQQQEEALQFDIDIEVEAVEEHKVEQVVKRFSVQEFYAKAVREFMQASDSAGEKVHDDVITARRIWNDVKSLPQDCGCEEEFVATHMKSLGYNVKMSWYSLMSQDVDSVLSITHNPEKNNKFLSIVPSSKDYDMDEFIVELCFKQQFVIQNPSQRYSDFLSLVPKEFIGTSEDLHSFLVLICDEMARAFAATGRSVPPWRRRGAVLARWTATPDAKNEDPRLLCDPYFVNFKILSGRQVHIERKKPVSLLSADLAARKSKASVLQAVGPRKGSRLIGRCDISKSVYHQISNLKMPAKLASSVRAPEVARTNIESMWADALIAQLNRGWFGVS